MQRLRVNGRFIHDEQWLKDNIEDRFWAKVKKCEDDGCWEWQGGMTSTTKGKEDGYGSFWYMGHSERAHRLAYIFQYGADSIPDGMCICHKCDNRKCVRPDHLFVGTLVDNAHDRDIKGRHYRPLGMKHPQSKLTNTQVLEIVRLANQGIPKQTVANIYNIHRDTVRYIMTGHTWSHITGIAEAQEECEGDAERKGNECI